MKPESPIRKSCSVEGCDRPYRCSGYCRLHYNRVCAKGDPGGVELKTTPCTGTCAQEDCPNPVRSKGLCNAHYQRMLIFGRADTPYAHPKCSAPGCSKWDNGTGYCRKHQRRIQVYGDLLADYPLGKPIPECIELPLRVMKMSVQLDDGCIKFMGKNRTKHGYASVGFRSKQWRVHRAMYEVLVAPIPVGPSPDGSDWTIDHLCRRIDCVNVEHMEVVSRRENLRRREVALGRLTETNLDTQETSHE